MDGPGDMHGLGDVCALWGIVGRHYPSPSVDGQTSVKTLPSHNFVCGR